MIVDRGYLDHWKTHALRQQTGLANAAELPLRLWEHCEARRDDFIADSTGTVIAGICRAALAPKDLVRALVDCRWLDKAKGGFVVHGWRERNASWLRKIAGGKLTASRSKRNASGQLTGSNADATGKEAPSQPDASTQLAGNSAGAVEWSGVEKSREPTQTDTPPSRTSAPTRACEAGALSETWHFILDLLGAKKRRAGGEAEHALARQAEALPLSGDQRAMLEWFYKLPHDERDIDLRGRFRDADKLAINLFASLERAERYAERHGGPQKKKGAAEPEGWREWFVGKWTDKPVPQNFAELPDYVQQDARRELQSERSAA